MAVTIPIKQRELVSEPCSVEHRLCSAVEVTTAAGKVEAPGSLENHFKCLFPMVTLLEMADTYLCPHDVMPVLLK